MGGNTAPAPNLALALGALALGALTLEACTDRILDRGLDYQYVKGEVLGVDEPEAPATPAPVRRMTGTNPDWPSLYLVPMRPPKPPTPQERQAAMDKLSADRDAARRADEALQAIAPPALPVPPKPEGVPGGPPAAATATGPGAGAAAPGGSTKPRTP